MSRASVASWALIDDASSSSTASKLPSSGFCARRQLVGACCSGSPCVARARTSSRAVGLRADSCRCGLRAQGGSPRLRADSTVTHVIRSVRLLLCAGVLQNPCGRTERTDAARTSRQISSHRVLDAPDRSLGARRSSRATRRRGPRRRTRASSPGCRPTISCGLAPSTRLPPDDGRFGTSSGTRTAAVCYGLKGLGLICADKVKTTTQSFCRNPYNVSGCVAIHMIRAEYQPMQPHVLPARQLALCDRPRA